MFGESLTYLDEQGRLPIDVIIQFLALKSDLMNFRLKLAYYDKNCIGNLNRQVKKNFFFFNKIKTKIFYSKFLIF